MKLPGKEATSPDRKYQNLQRGYDGSPIAMEEELENVVRFN